MTSDRDRVETTCPRCNVPSELVFVHGHWQCRSCGQVVQDCCDGGASETNTDDS